MGQKVHPHGFRLGISKEHSAKWFAPGHEYASWLKEDRKIRSYLMDRFNKTAGISLIKTRRRGTLLEVEIHTAKPGAFLVPSSDGQRNLASVRKGLETILPKQAPLSIRLVEVTQPDRQASLLALSIGSQLEGRVAFRRALKQAVRRAQKTPGVLGVKVQIAGRLNGAEIARSEWAREGRVPLHTLRADVDYAHHTATTVYGILGIKVWIFRGEASPLQGFKNDRSGITKPAPAFFGPRLYSNSMKTPSGTTNSGDLMMTEGLNPPPVRKELLL